ncbi:MAG: DnaD domain protein [Bacilli bacterium]|nr:DnaD domain protein [Bacilli bacterium]MBR3209818.1 DnaD domain protein [Bacilli bacterium]
MTSKIIELIKNGSITIPKLLITKYKLLKITEKELILIIYLMNNNEFDPERISEDLNIEIPETLKMIDDLGKKDILKIETTNGNICEEYINLDELYNKLALTIINEEEKPVTNLFDKFEREFGRTLSPMEYEIIGAWLDNNYTEEIIEEALKEAIYNGVTSLKYIDKILSEWNKKGIKTKDDIKTKNTKKENKKEVFEYDWLNEQN